MVSVFEAHCFYICFHGKKNGIDLNASVFHRVKATTINIYVYATIVSIIINIMVFGDVFKRKLYRQYGHVHCCSAQRSIQCL
jgi:hypothetical protein